jgi:hypothetical protein
VHLHLLTPELDIFLTFDNNRLKIHDCPSANSVDQTPIVEYLPHADNDKPLWMQSRHHMLIFTESMVFIACAVAINDMEDSS